MPQEIYLLYCMNKPHCFITTGKQFNNKVAKSKMTLAIPYCYHPQGRCKESPVQRKTSQRICLNITYLNQLGQLLLEGSFFSFYIYLFNLDSDLTMGYVVLILM